MTSRIKEMSIIVNDGKVREIGEVEIFSLFRGVSHGLKDENPGTIIAIADGGYWLGHWLKGYFGCKNYYEVSASHYTIGGKKNTLTVDKLPDGMKLIPPVLIVDDVVETGETMMSFISNVMARGIGLHEILTASLVWKPIGSKVKPKVFAVATDQWVLFPWEILR